MLVRGSLAFGTYKEHSEYQAAKPITRQAEDKARTLRKLKNQIGVPDKTSDQISHAQFI
jgi:hypothetical protein